MTSPLTVRRAEPAIIENSANSWRQRGSAFAWDSVDKACFVKIPAEAAESKRDANLSKEPDYSDRVTARREF